MTTNFDIIIVGGGPAGAMTAWKAAQGGASVLLLERDREIGIPVRCAEGVSMKVLHDYFAIDEKWIANKIDGAELITPDGTVTITEATGDGCVLERRFFDAYIAGLAGEAGAEIWTRTDVTHAERFSEGWKLRATVQGTEMELHAKLLVAADGVESRVAQWAGFDTALDLDDLESGAQYDMVNLELDNPHHCYFYFGNEIAPGGYVWIFPKSRNRANVGIGVLASRAQKPAKEYLDAFIAKNLPQAKAVGFVTGGVPVARPLKELVADRFMAVGDAARLVNPTSGAGIGHAIISGAFAGETAASAIKNNELTKSKLKSYEKKWNRAQGASLKIYYQIKNAFLKMNDDELSRVNALCSQVGKDKLTLFELFKIAMKNDPKLLLDLPKLFFK